MTNRFVKEVCKTQNLQIDPLISAFFSDSNMQLIQKTLKNYIKTSTGYTIDTQSNSNLFVVMLWVYTNFNKPCYNSKQVSHLNALTLEELVPMVRSNVLQYVQYLKDISTLPTPIEHGKSTNMTNQQIILNPPW
uniref:Minor capsid protein P8 central region domain-containing protein n=1 Tax=viral metagenome TaxID=1070528 RepID=A0A6C0F5P9_9ZZZZ|tara:strand:+ start:6118 stop:6519 length:402 start_codon:yes stop_codon:yes gene_type:complete